MLADRYEDEAFVRDGFYPTCTDCGGTADTICQSCNANVCYLCAEIDGETCIGCQAVATD